MDAGRLGLGERIAGAAALVLLVVMFLGWFSLDGLSADVGDVPEELVPSGALELSQEDLEASAEAAGEDTSASAWQAFSVIDIVLVLTILAAVALVAARASGNEPDLPAPLGAVVAGLGALATLLILFRLISPPDLIDAFGAGGGLPGEIEIETDVGRQIWAFVGLIAAAAIAYGGWLSMREEGTPPGTQNTGTAAGDPPPGETV